MLAFLIALLIMLTIFAVAFRAAFLLISDHWVIMLLLFSAILFIGVCVIYASLKAVIV